MQEQINNLTTRLYQLRNGVALANSEVVTALALAKATAGTPNIDADKMMIDIGNLMNVFKPIKTEALDVSDLSNDLFAQGKITGSENDKHIVMLHLLKAVGLELMAYVGRANDIIKAQAAALDKFDAK
jgi:hypothetical protein